MSDGSVGFDLAKTGLAPRHLHNLVGRLLDRKKTEDVLKQLEEIAEEPPLFFSVDHSPY